MTVDRLAAGGPVSATDRIDYLDILRGFAVMAIFIVNIKAMAMPFAYYNNPELWSSGLDQHIALIQRYLVDDKWRTTFSALYGAGLLMIWQRLEARGEGRGTLFRRNGFLLLFGAIHLVFIWVGDILTMYGLVGFAALLFVRMGTARLTIFGFLILAVGIAWSSGFQLLFTIEGVAEKIAPKFWAPTEESLAAEMKAVGGSIVDQITFRSAGAIGILVLVVFGGMGMTTLGLMVLGMALFRAGLYRGTWPPKLTLPLAVLALGAAWSLDGLQIAKLEASGWSFETFNRLFALQQVDGVLGAFGYACLVSAIVGFGVRFAPVAAVGRMAFTNYITCSLIGTTLAGGHAFGLYGKMTLAQLMIVVVVTFVLMLVWSPLWLRFFRFGPLEWLWRSLVYKAWQPFLR